MLFQVLQICFSWQILTLNCIYGDYIILFLVVDSFNIQCFTMKMNTTERQDFLILRYQLYIIFLSYTVTWNIRNSRCHSRFSNDIIISCHMKATYVILTLILFHQTQTRRLSYKHILIIMMKNITIKIFNENIKINIL